MIPVEAAKAVQLSTTNSTLNPTMERTDMKLRTRKRNSHLYNLPASVCSVLLAICAAQVGFTQQNATTQSATQSTPVALVAATQPASLSALDPVAQAAEEETEPATPAKGGDGIKVHGHWKFVVHDRDGKLVSTKEFENSLITPASGDFLIASALLGQSVTTDWGIVLCPVAGTGWATPPYTSGRMLAGTFCPGTNSPIGVLVPSFTTIAGSIFSFSNFCDNTTNDPNPTGNAGNLCVTGMTQALTGGTTGNPGYSITLSGNFTAIMGVTINSVGTYTGYCPPPGAGQFSTTAASACEGQGIAVPRFSQTATSPSMLVFTGTNQTQILSAGQILTITVTISFS